MLNGFDNSLEERLKQAELAEKELQRLQPIAAEAPLLRSEREKTTKELERRRAKAAAMHQAEQAVQAAAEKQTKVPELLGTSARAVKELFLALRDVENLRREAMQALANVDRVDYEMELEEGEAHEQSLDRDTRGLAYALAARHGDARVKRLLDEMTPGFTMLQGCNLDDPIYRDLANFVVERVQTPPRQAAPRPATPQPKQPNGIKSET